MRFRELFRRLRRAPAPRPARTETTEACWLQALSDFGYPHSIVSGVQAPAALQADTVLGAREGFSPVIIAPGHWNSDPIPPQKRTARALKMLRERCDAAAGKEFLEQCLAQLYDDLELDPECLDPAVFDTLQPVAAPHTRSGLALLQRYDKASRSFEPEPRVAIMRIPTTDASTIPAHLDWGGWNSVPSSIELVATSRYWGERYGARLVAIGSDVLEFEVARKPASRTEAIALLREQYCFAPDNWENDRNTLEQAAAELQVNDTWFFWWD